MHSFRAAVATLLLAALPAPALAGYNHRVPIGDLVVKLRDTGAREVSPGRTEHVVRVKLRNRGPATGEITLILVSRRQRIELPETKLVFEPLARDGRSEAYTVRVFRPGPATIKPKHLALALAFEIARDEQGFEIDPPGEWLDGDLHVHATGASNDTGGDSLPEDIAQVARERGLFFVVLTDHSNSTGSDPTTTDEDPALFNQGPEFPYWDEAAALSEPGEFLLVDGNELSPRAVDGAVTGHVGCIPPDLEDFDRSGAFVDRPRGEVSGGEALAQAREQGCFTVLNHPYGPQNHVAYDWESFDYDAMEVWNGGLGAGFIDQSRSSLDAWRCDLLQGRDVVPLGTSDNHRVYTEEPGIFLAPALGVPRTSVYARERTWPAIVEALQAGRVRIHGGESRLGIDGYDEGGLRAESSAMRDVRLRGRLDPAADPSTLALYRASACVDPRPAPLAAVEIDDQVLHREVVQPGASFDVTVAVDGAPGVYTATLIPEEPTQLLYGVALSRAIVLR